MYFTCNFISEFLANFGYIARSGSALNPEDVTQHHYQQSAPYSNFLVFSTYYGIYYHIWKCPWPWKHSPTLAPTVSTILQFSLICLLFYCYFLFRKLHITIFGNVLLTLKTFPNATTKSEHCLPNFPNFSEILVIITSSKPPTAPLST